MFPGIYDETHERDMVEITFPDYIILFAPANTIFIIQLIDNRSQEHQRQKI